MIREFALAAAIASVAISGSALAAQPVSLGAVKGSVLVNQSGKFEPVTASTTLRAGDRVLATDGSAQLKYADGCVVSVTARSMATIGDESPCGGSSNVVKAAYQTEGYDADGPGGQAGFWVYTAMGVLTFVALGSAISDDETPDSP